MLSIKAKRKFKQNVCNNTEKSKLMSTTHKHCYDMKAQTDNAEHINDNGFSILFLWVKDSNNKDNNALEKNLFISKFGELGATLFTNVLVILS